jgi:hypothetical protein
MRTWLHGIGFYFKMAVRKGTFNFCKVRLVLSVIINVNCAIEWQNIFIWKRFSLSFFVSPFVILCLEIISKVAGKSYERKSNYSRPLWYNLSLYWLSFDFVYLENPFLKYIYHIASLQASVLPNFIRNASCYKSSHIVTVNQKIEV